MLNKSASAQSSLNLALIEVKDLLTDFVFEPNFDSQVSLAFGLSSAQQGDRAREIIVQWLDGSGILPELKIVPDSLINNAEGAYAAETNTIYLSQEYLAANSNNIEAISNLVIEELGHSFSSQLTLEEVPGDEGAIFSLLVQEGAIESSSLIELQAEEDIATVVIDNEEIQIEQAQIGVNPAFDLIGLTALRNDPNFADIDGTGFDVVVIDTGLDQTHPFLDDNYRLGLDLVEGDADPNDINGHGTHVAGTIGAEDENIGVAPDVGLIGIKAGNERFSDSVLNDALQRVLNEANDPNSELNIAAVNLSLGGGFYTTPNQPNSDFDIEARRIIQDLEAAGVVVVAAAGNSYIGKPDSEGFLFSTTGDVIDPNQELNISSPAIYSTIAVGAVWQDNRDPTNLYTPIQNPGEDRVTVFSQRLDSDNFLFAPGALINSTVPQKLNGDLFSGFAGTSQASPHVAGAVALLQEIAAGYDVRLSPEQIRNYLIGNADIVNDGDDEEDVVTNSGLSYPRINIHQSAIALRNDLESNSVVNNPVEEETEVVFDDVIASAIDVTLGNDREPLIFDGVIGLDQGVPVTSADVDLYRITIPDNGFLEVDIDTPYADFPDSYLRLFGESGEELFFTDNDQLVASDDDLAPGETSTNNTDFRGVAVVVNDDSGTELIDGVRDENGYQPGNYGHSTDSFLSFSAERGETYYIGVSDFNNQQYDPTTLDNRPAPSNEGQYELIATFFNNDINGSIPQVTEIEALSTDSIRASVGEDNETSVGDKDVDIYRVNSPTAGILELDIDSRNDASIVDSVDSVVVLFDEQGNFLGMNDDANFTDSLLRFQIEANTNYYAAVTGYGNEDFDPLALGSGSGGDTGEYILNSRILPSSESFSISNSVIDGDSVRDVILGDSIGGRIGEDNGQIIGATDVDLYRFVPAANNIVGIRVDASQSFDADTFLRFFDANGDEIAFNDDENSTTRGSFLEVEVEADTEYYIGVNGYSPEARNYDPLTGADAAPGVEGDYTLTISNLGEPERPTLPDDEADDSLSVYRFLNRDTGVHFYTASEVERDAIIDDLPNFTFEGVSYRSVDPLTGSDATPVYRFLNRNTGVHLYTASEIEREAVSNLSNYTFEGEAFYAYAEQVEDSIPVHRFYNRTADAHFYTPSEVEREAVETGLPNYQYESIAYYVPSDI